MADPSITIFLNPRTAEARFRDGSEGRYSFCVGNPASVQARQPPSMEMQFV